MTVHIHQEGGAVIIELGALPEEGAWPLLASQLPLALDGSTAVVIEVSGLTLLPAEVGALARMMASLPECDLALACTRMSGRRVLHQLLSGQVPIVARPAALASHRPARAPSRPTPAIPG